MPTAEGDTVYEDLPIVPNVKVCFPSGGLFNVSWPIEPGDSIILVSCNFAIGQWRQGNNAQTVLPGDLRVHALGSSFALPLLTLDSRATPDAQASQNAFIIHGPMIVLGDHSATDFAALASKCDANFDAIKVLFDGWTPSPGDGGGALKTAAASLSLQATACSQVKIK